MLLILLLYEKGKNLEKAGFCILIIAKQNNLKNADYFYFVLKDQIFPVKLGQLLVNSIHLIATMYLFLLLISYLITK